ncbi:UNVERIFIED_CONTAM: hypothetical protein Sradi_0411100 [Sesamum radiatum]|uniref:Uncharacterized protein n=1 Tax=Sesamum radiatum TaxID=300843 RepID=A0AAW2W613_SESRA
MPLIATNGHRKSNLPSFFTKKVKWILDVIVAKYEGISGNPNKTFKNKAPSWLRFKRVGKLQWPPFFGCFSSSSSLQIRLLVSAALEWESIMARLPTIFRHRHVSPISSDLSI